ncbi:hypothetical protein RHS01_03848 [Rhizoctonia solani]|uniref:Uncharacterized protein n=1 Tax=Rhizoctonia solani TaxID=456999 RepID=A0A8H7IG69_9AGAM|nr:hypothetical protein RHS01_03848 [Rhizoctonia solani]
MSIPSPCSESPSPPGPSFQLPANMTNPTPEITQVVEAVPGTTTPISQASTSTVNSSTDPSPAKVEEKIRRFDFGFIPIPTYLRHHPEKPFISRWR